jgi:hypothetical protein
MIGVPSTPPPPPTVREIWSESLRFWEKRRLIYNLVLTATVITAVARTHAWHFAASPAAWLGLVFAAIMANICYCAAYPVDVALQYSDFREAWLAKRSWLLALGCFLGACITLMWLPLALVGTT